MALLRGQEKEDVDGFSLVVSVSHPPLTGRTGDLSLKKDPTPSLAGGGHCTSEWTHSAVGGICGRSPFGAAVWPLRMEQKIPLL